MERRPFDKFNDKPQRFSREGQYSADRSFDRGGRFERQNERYGYRSGQYEDRRRDRDSTREWGREEEGYGRSYGDRQQRFPGRRDSWHEGRRDRQEFSSRSGPRARAADSRRFSDRNAFARGGTVRLDADVAQYFRTAGEVNSALRQVIALAGMVRKEPVEKVPSEAETGQVRDGEVPAEDVAVLPEESADGSGQLPPTGDEAEGGEPRD